MILYFPKHEKPSIYAAFRYIFNSGSTPVYSMPENRIKWGFSKHRVIFRVIVWYNILNLIKGAQRRKEGPVYKQAGLSFLNGQSVCHNV